MSEPIPESVPTSADPKSKRPVKRRTLTPTSQHANSVTALFAKPDREVFIPPSDIAGKISLLPAPPEIVANVQGSSAGAGSGEFHVYKASRRREYERVKMMEKEVIKESADADFEARQSERKKKDEDRTNKNRKRREKLKMKKGQKTDGQINGAVGDGETSGQTQIGQDDGQEDALSASQVEEVGVTIYDDD